MNRFIITLTALIILLPSCGNKETSTKKNNPIEVLTEDWLDVFATDFHTANSQFEELVKVQETNITSEELEEKVIKTINYMDSLIVKSTVYSITGKNAEELKKSAENYKEKNNVF